VRKKISITINEKILGEIDHIIDNIYIRNRSQAIEHLVNSALGENKAAVILCGGDEDAVTIEKGTYRFTAKIKNSTVIELAIKKLRNSGFKTVYIIARHNVLTSIFNILHEGSGYGLKINYIEERKSNGSFDSIKLIKGRISTSFLVVYGDILFGKINLDELWNDHLKQNSLTTIMLTTSNKPSEKGTVRVEGSRVLTFTQKPKQSDIYLVFSPIFVAEPEILEYEGESLEKDVFPVLAEKGLLNGHLSSEKERHIHSKKDVTN